MDTESVILTVIGADKPGLVERLATIVADHHGNWLESRMARLAGQFAGILQVEVASAHREALVQALNRVHDGSLQVTASRLGASRAETTVTQRVRLGSARHCAANFASHRGMQGECRRDRDNGRKCADVWRDAL